MLGAVIAYHPSTRRRVSSLEHFEQPKTLLMYAVVAAVVALIVEVQPSMAFAWHVPRVPGPRPGCSRSQRAVHLHVQRSR